MENIAHIYILMTATVYC